MIEGISLLSLYCSCTNAFVQPARSAGCGQRYCRAKVRTSRAVNRPTKTVSQQASTSREVVLLRAVLVIVRLVGDLRFHDLRHTWASRHQHAGTSTDELRDLGGWKTRNVVDRNAKFCTKHLTRAAARIASGTVENVGNSPTFSPRSSAACTEDCARTA